MGKRIDLLGKTIGPYLVVGKEPSSLRPGGATVGKWRVRCRCGKEKIKLAGKLCAFVNGKISMRDTCGPTCGNYTIKSTCKCGVEATRHLYARKQTRVKNKWTCPKCAQLRGGAAVRGKPASNRLPGDEGGFRLLISRYKANARQRGIHWGLSESEFRAITKQPCNYCGSEPSAISRNDKGLAPGYVYNGVDRVDSQSEYSNGNVVSCCSTCNYMKQDTGIEKFLDAVEKIYLMSIAPKSGNRVFIP